MKNIALLPRKNKQIDKIKNMSCVYLNKYYFSYESCDLESHRKGCLPYKGLP